MIYIIEILVVLLIAYGCLHENELIEFETIIKQYVKKRWLNGKHKNSCNNNHN